MWLFKSSIGRKFVMAVTGVCLVLFVTFHVLMNSVALIWPAAYNSVCEFLGANWYALAASMGLALLFVLHIIYAVWLTLQNRAARGTDRYAVTARQPQVEWASKNMLVLGIVIVAFLIVHLVQFWAKMQWNELCHATVDQLPQVNGIPAGPAQGTMMLQLAFSEWWTPVVYIIGFVALWFHMTHGFWSMFQTVGWDNNNWLGRLKTISNWWTSIVVLLFVAQAVLFTVRAHQNYYIDAPELQEQYAEFWNEKAADAVAEFNAPMYAEYAKMQAVDQSNMIAAANARAAFQNFQQTYLTEEGPAFLEKATAITEAYQKACPEVPPTQEMQQLQQMVQQLQYMVQQTSENVNN